MGSYNFKSVGTTTSQSQDQSLKTSPVPVGIVTPLREGSNEGLFAMTYNLADQVQYNMHDLIMTNWGERLGLYNFGANLKPLTADFTTQDDFDSLAVQRIGDAVRAWMPYVELEDYASSTNKSDDRSTSLPSQIKIMVTYNVIALNVQKRALEITLRVM